MKEEFDILFAEHQKLLGELQAMRAVAKPEQEPVAWMSNAGGVVTGDEGRDDWYCIPLYTTPPQPKKPEQEPENRCVRELREFAKSNQGAYIFPSWDGHRVLKYLGDTTPPQRTWVGLTDEERKDLCRWWSSPMDAIYATEAKLKDKNT